MGTTISTHNGSTIVRGHNIRLPAFVRRESHIAPGKVHEIWRDETQAHAYERLFSAAVEEYNNRQSRADRRIKNYYADVKKDAKKHTAYELIITIGNRDNMPPPGIGKQIMRRYVDDFQERNPNLIVIGAYYHADERDPETGKPSAPHVHIDYIPIAHGYKRGPETQTGLVKALGEMGIVKHGKDTAQILWEHRENEYLEFLCNEYGIDDIIHPQAGTGVKHLQKQAYQAKQERDKALQETRINQALAEDAEQQLIQKSLEMQQLNAQCRQLKKERSELEAANKALKQQEESNRETLAAWKDKIRSALQKLNMIKEQVNTMEQEKDTLTQQVKEANAVIEKAKRAGQILREAEQQIRQMQEKYTALLHEIKKLEPLQEKVKALQAEAEKWKGRANAARGRAEIYMEQAHDADIKGRLERLEAFCARRYGPEDETLLEMFDRLEEERYQESIPEIEEDLDRVERKWGALRKNGLTWEDLDDYER